MKYGITVEYVVTSIYTQHLESYTSTQRQVMGNMKLET
jgi:hypothetical protein